LKSKNEEPGRRVTFVFPKKKKKKLKLKLTNKQSKKSQWQQQQSAVLKFKKKQERKNTTTQVAVMCKTKQGNKQANSPDILQILKKKKKAFGFSLFLSHTHSYHMPLSRVVTHSTFDYIFKKKKKN
jgi:hypothetical protein